MNFEEAQKIILSNCLKIDGKPNSSNKTRKTHPNTEALDRNWWYEGDTDRDNGPGTRETAFLLSYLQISGNVIPMDGLVLSDGYIWLDRAVMRKLDKFGYIRMGNGIIAPTEKGRALVAPYLAVEDATQPEIARTLPRIEQLPGKDEDMQPTNLILHGPPGTGKTYATAAEALRLCGEPVPDSRNEVMAAYDRLRAEKRIEFVTFHQSMSYEEFIEGRQPTTEDNGEGGSGTGFRLETVPGIFRRIAIRAETSKAKTKGPSLQDRGIWRFPLRRFGEGGLDLSEDALRNRRIRAVSDADIDWSGPEFDDRDAIMERLRESDPNIAETSWQAVEAKCIRAWMKKGDIVIATEGSHGFRAVGIVTGDYEYDEHREFPGASSFRTVDWKWQSDKARPLSDITPYKLVGHLMHGMTKSAEHEPALAGLLAEPTEGAPPPHVLVIDEINRANISKVFGELITLIEPDKRTGMPNALTVRLPYSGEEFGVPANLHILGTMNTADRSIALLDTALRRRFDFREMMPEPDIKAMHDAAERCGLDLPRILTVLNKRIEYLYDREHQIGHAYFVNCNSREDVDAVMRYRVIPLLAEYFFEDWGKVAAVLGDAAPHEGPIDGGFMIRTILQAPPGMEDAGDGAPRFRWSLRQDGFSYHGLTDR